MGENCAKFPVYKYGQGEVMENIDRAMEIVATFPLSGGSIAPELLRIIDRPEGIEGRLVRATGRAI